jgi:hypothetical protein
MKPEFKPQFQQKEKKKKRKKGTEGPGGEHSRRAGETS